MIQKEILKTKDSVILIVDDNKDNVDLIEDILSGEGYTKILKASSGSEALLLIFEKLPDLLILDIMMPDMDGYEVCSALHDNKETTDIPIIMVTAKTQTEDLKRAFELGAFDYITKPYEEDELMARVQSALKLKQSKDELKRKNVGYSYLNDQYRSAIDKLNQQIYEQKKVEKQLLESEEKLRKSERRYSTIVEEGNDAIIIVKDFKVVFGNKKATELTGYTLEEAYKLDLLKVINPKQGLMALHMFRRRMAGEDVPSIYELEIFHKDGHVIPVELSIATIEYQGEGADVIFLHDISGQKKEEARLKKTIKDLKRSNKDLDQFAYTVSHDLQEPLRMVSNYLQLLSRRYKGKLDSDADEFINYAVDGAKRMYWLINDLLLYSQVDIRGKHFEPTNCETVLNQALSNLKIAINENDAVITHDPLPIVVADDIQLTQLFQNIIGNAIKYCGKKTPEVHVSAQKKINRWVFSVKDNGIGIEPEYQDQIFQIFTRLQTNEEYKGTGIGLTVCKKIVERHGGKIWLESEPGNGSTFFFSIPIDRENIHNTKEGENVAKGDLKN